MDEIIVWLIRGSQRKTLFLNLPEIPFLPNKFRKHFNERFGMNLSLREMSRHLKNLEEKDLVKCVNKDDPYNRIYELTLNGKKIQKQLSKLNL